MGSKWVQTGPNGSKWVHMGLNGYKWVQMGPNGSKCVQIGPNVSKWVQVGLSYFVRKVPETAQDFAGRVVLAQEARCGKTFRQTRRPGQTDPAQSSSQARHKRRQRSVANYRDQVKEGSSFQSGPFRRPSCPETCWPRAGPPHQPADRRPR